MRDDVAAEILAIGLLGPGGARGGIEQPLFVVSPQAQAADGLIGCGASGAAEAPSGAGRQAAMRADGIGRDLFAPGELCRGQRVHRTIRRRTARITSSPRLTCTVTSHCPRARAMSDR